MNQRKSRNVWLTSLFLTSLAACSNNNDRWINGNDDPHSRDTLLHGNMYRSYHGGWYPVYNNRISPDTYNGASINEISSPSFHSSLRSGGFGSSAHSSGEGAGE